MRRILRLSRMTEEAKRIPGPDDHIDETTNKGPLARLAVLGKLFGRQRLDATDHPRHFTLGSAAVGIDVDSGDRIHHIHAVDDLPEGGVLAIEMLALVAAQADEELASRTIRITGSSHRKHALLVGTVVELGLQLMAGTTGARHACGALGSVRAAALNDEAWQDPMKTKTVVEALLAELEHVLNVVRCHVLPQLDGDGAMIGLDGGLGMTQVRAPLPVVLREDRAPRSRAGERSRNGGLAGSIELSIRGLVLRPPVGRAWEAGSSDPGRSSRFR